MASLWTLKGREERVNSLLSRPENKSVTMLTPVDENFKLSNKASFVCRDHGEFTRTIISMENNYLCPKCRESSLDFLKSDKKESKSTVVKKRNNFVRDLRNKKKSNREWCRIPLGVLKERVDELLDSSKNKGVTLLSKLDKDTMMSTALKWECEKHGIFKRSLNLIRNPSNKNKGCICSACHGGKLRNIVVEKVEIKDENSFKVDRVTGGNSVEKIIKNKEGYMISHINSIFDGVLGIDVALKTLFTMSLHNSEISKVYSDLMTERVKIREACLRVDKYYRTYLESKDE